MLARFVSLTALAPLSSALRKEAMCHAGLLEQSGRCRNVSVRRFKGPIALQRSCYWYPDLQLEEETLEEEPLAA